MKEPDESLSAADRAWLDRTADRYAARPLPLQVRRADLLLALRDRVGADYVCWGAGVRDGRTDRSACLEFQDQIDFALAEDPTPDPRVLRWSRVVRRGNTDERVTRLYTAIAAGHPHLTVTGRMVMATQRAGFRRAGWAGRVGMVVAAGLAAPNMVEWARSGLGDFMLTLRQLPRWSDTGAGPAAVVFGSVVSYSRAAGRPPFGPAEQSLAHAASGRFPWVHTVTADPAFDCTTLSRPCQLLLPLLSGPLDYKQIATRLGVPRRTIERQARQIAEHLGLPDQTRGTFRHHFRAGHVPAATGVDPARELAAGRLAFRPPT